jgi:hypothetical protein
MGSRNRSIKSSVRNFHLILIIEIPSFANFIQKLVNLEEDFDNVFNGDHINLKVLIQFLLTRERRLDNKRPTKVL